MSFSIQFMLFKWSTEMVKYKTQLMILKLVDWPLSAIGRCNLFLYVVINLARSCSRTSGLVTFFFTWPHVNENLWLHNSLLKLSIKTSGIHDLFKAWALCSETHANKHLCLHQLSLPTIHSKPSIRIFHWFWGVGKSTLASMKTTNHFSKAFKYLNKNIEWSKLDYCHCAITCSVPFWPCN